MLNQGKPHSTMIDKKIAQPTVNERVLPGAKEEQKFESAVKTPRCEQRQGRAKRSRNHGKKQLMMSRSRQRTAVHAPHYHCQRAGSCNNRSSCPNCLMHTPPPPPPMGWIQPRMMPMPHPGFCQVPVPAPALPVPYQSPYGRVLATVYDGTTFYLYERPQEQPKAAETAQEQVKPPQKGEHIFSPEILRTDSFSTQSPNSSLSPSPDCRGSLSLSSSLFYKSASSSRSSSPFLSFTDSSSATRDSGLVSTASTDEDVASVQEESAQEKEYEQTLRKIMEAVEEVFSDHNLAKDHYLLRQIKRSSSGFVSIKLLASIKAIKKLTRDYKTVALGVRRSSKLEIHQNGSKVRRKSALPEQLKSCKEDMTLLVTNLAEDADLEDAARLFKPYGAVAQLRVIRPGSKLPQYLQGYAKVAPQLGKVTCALVEFEAPGCTLNAFNDLTTKDNGMHFAILGERMRKRLIKNEKLAVKVENEVTPEICLGHTLATRHNSNDSNRSDCDSGIYEAVCADILISGDKAKSNEKAQIVAQSKPA